MSGLITVFCRYFLPCLLKTIKPSSSIQFQQLALEVGATFNAMLSSFSSPAMADQPQSMAGDQVHMNTDSIQFEKTLTSANVPNGVPNSRCSLEIPPWFVEKHGDKFEEYVILRCSTSAQPRAPWVVRVSVSAEFPVVRMSCGWKKFAAFNGLREGHSVVFCLRALSEFEVFVTGSHALLPPSSVEALLCEPLGMLLVAPPLPSHRNFHPDFPMENVRVSSLRNSQSPAAVYPDRTVSFSGIDTVYVDTPGLTKHHSQIRLKF